METQLEFIVVSETEKLLVTEDVRLAYSTLLSKGMKSIKMPSCDPVCGLRAFVLDVDGVLIEIRRHLD